MTTSEAIHVLDKLIAFEQFCLRNMPDYKRNISYMRKEVEALNIAKTALEEVSKCENIGRCPVT